MPPLWFFGSGFKRIWSTDLKFCDFSYMVIGWVPTKFQADLMMFWAFPEAFLGPGWKKF